MAEKNEIVKSENLWESNKNVNPRKFSKDIKCGFGLLKGPILQKFATKKLYVLLYGIAGCLITASSAYWTGTISTMEKRFKIPSRNTGIISTGNDLSQLLVAIFVTYYASKKHKPRWIAFGLLLVAASCAFTVLPHFIYGAGDDFLSLTEEYGGIPGDRQTFEVIENEKRKTLCRLNEKLAATCDVREGNLEPQIILFAAQFLAGIGGTLCSTLGITYMDDNVKKSKSPALISLTYFLKLLGPALGYTLASFSLKIFIVPDLHPTITTTDPRWLGAWWLGWFIFTFGIFLMACLIGLFPRTLPRAAARKQMIAEEKQAKKLMDDNYDDDDDEEDEVPVSLADMWETLKRLLKNRILMLNNIAGVFYVFSFLSYWMFMPKYIENQYNQSASASNLYTGTVAFVFTALGILVSGFMVSKFKPSARKMATWNVLTGLLTALIFFAYIRLGCDANDNAMTLNQSGNETTLAITCNSGCQCDYVKYSPVCGEDGNSYISACHAGCTEKVFKENSTQQIFKNCACVTKLSVDDESDEYTDEDVSNETSDELFYGQAIPGSCPVDCSKEFFIFLIIFCLENFISATGFATNFMVSVRCVKEKDKSVSIGLGMAMSCLGALIPSPIVFGAIIDSTCLIWGKTCSGTGNCWLYDGPSFRLLLNGVAGGVTILGVVLDVGVWYYVKDLKIFDEKPKNTVEESANEEKDLSNVVNGEEVTQVVATTGDGK